MAKVKHKKKKGEKGNDLLENPDVLAEKLSRSEEFLEKNRVIVISVIGGLAVIVSAIFLFRYYVSNQNNQAQVDMFQAVYYFESDSIQKALHGDGNNYGFLEIIDNYGITKTANLANFYAGASYLKLGEFQNAIDYLSEFSSNDLVVKARALALMGDAQMELGEYREAAESYEKAASQNPNQYLSPLYLTKAALAYEKLMDYEAAAASYAIIVEKYPESGEYNNARKHKARLEELASN
ncbi:MAG: tetratricopeptide repeat protein [Cyclobacteriaceae bacterium]|nr:tetratricopeptide repeat protein [Cyclobacteriaceae bacterium]